MQASLGKNSHKKKRCTSIYFCTQILQISNSVINKQTSDWGKWMVKPAWHSHKHQGWRSTFCKCTTRPSPLHYAHTYRKSASFVSLYGGTSYCLFCSLTAEIHHLLASFFFLPHITIFFKTLFKIIKNHRSYSWMKFVSATQCIVYSRHWNNNIFFFTYYFLKLKNAP